MRTFDIKNLFLLSCLRFQFRSSFSVNADELSSLTFILELHKALDQRKQCVILTTTDIVAGLPLCSSLSGEDISTKHLFAAELLKSQPLRIRVATVSG